MTTEINRTPPPPPPPPPPKPAVPPPAETQAAPAPAPAAPAVAPDQNETAGNTSKSSLALPGEAAKPAKAATPDAPEATDEADDLPEEAEAPDDAEATDEKAGADTVAKDDAKAEEAKEAGDKKAAADEASEKRFGYNTRYDHSVGELAEQLGTDADTLMKANGWSDANMAVGAGTAIKVPDTTASRGLAQSYGGTITELDASGGFPKIEPPKPGEMPKNFPFSAQDIANKLGAPLENVERNLPGIASAIAEAGITDKNAIIGLLATVKTEVGSFEPINEYGSDSYFAENYNGRSDLGNRPGTNDGVTYHGRGYIQLTGRHNYETYGNKIGVDLVNHPEKALEPATSAKILVQYFQDHGLIGKAQAGDWEGVRRGVNGGLNGWDTFQGAVGALG